MICPKFFAKINFFKNKPLLITLIILFICSIIGISIFTYQNHKNVAQIKNSEKLNCNEYQDYSSDDEKSASGYIQCTLDEKITQLNNKHQYEEQNEYWDNIYSIIEHSFENKIKYKNTQPTLIGKYNTMDKIYLACYKEGVLYNLGKISLGLEEYVGPDYMYEGGTWKKYLEVTKSSNADFAKLSNEEQIVLAKKIQKQNEYLSDKFKNDYFKKVYITELMGIEYNATDLKAKETLHNISTQYKEIQNNENNTIKSLEAKETWKKLKEHVYFDTKSLKLTDNGREGYFKIYKEATDNNLLFDNYDNSAYAIYKIGIDNNGNILFPEYEYFDKKGNSIFAETPFAYEEGKYSEYKNGQIYYNALYK